MQTKLGNIATAKVNKALGVTIKIEKVDLSFLGAVKLKGVVIKDHHKDTLIYVNKLKTSILNAKKIVNNKVNLGAVSLNGVKFNLKTYKGETNDNLSIFVESFDDGKPRNPNSPPFILKTSNISIENLHFKFLDYNKKESLQYAVKNGGGTVQNFLVVGPKVTAAIRGLYFTDNRNLKVSNLTTNFLYSKTQMRFDSTSVKTNNGTKLNGNVVFNYKRKDLAKFNDKVAIKANFIKSKLAVKDLNSFYKELKGNDIFYFTTNMEGVLNNFSLKNFDLTSKNGIKINGNLDFLNAINTKRGFVFNADMQDITATYAQLKNVLPNVLGKTLPSEFKRLGEFSLNGIIALTPEEMEATLSVNSEIGSINSDLKLTNIDTIDEASYTGEVAFYNFDFGTFTNDPLLGEATLYADVNGKGFTIENINTTIIGTVYSLDFKKYTYKNISVNGVFENKKFDGYLKANDDNFKLEFQGLADFSNQINNFDFNASIGFIDLQKTNLFTRDSIATLQGKIKIDISGNNLDNIVGAAKFKNIKYNNQYTNFVFKDFEVQSSVKDSIKTIKIASEDIVNGKLSGKFSFEELFPITQNAFGNVYANYQPYKVTKGQFLDFDFTIHNQIIDVFLPQIFIGENTHIKGKINADKNLLKLNFDSPKIKAYTTVLDTVRLRVNTKNPLYNTHLTAQAINTKYYKLKELNLLNRTHKDTLFFKSVFKGDKQEKEKFNLDFFYTINKEKKSVVGVQKSTFNYKNYNWIINPTDNAENKVAFDLKTKDFTISPFTIRSKNQEIAFKGMVKDSTYKNITASFKNVALESFLPPVDSLHLAGKLNGNISYLQKENQIKPQGNLKVNNFHINKYYQGDLLLDVIGENSNEVYTVNLALENEKAKNIKGNGSIDFSKNRPTINLNCAIQNYQIAAFSPLGQEVLSKLRGEVTGNFIATGFLGNPNLQGELKLKDAGLKFPYLNVDFAIQNKGSILLKEQQFIFNNIFLEDTKHKTEGLLRGDISHKNFENWNLNLDLQTDNLLVLDTKESEDSPYYGTGFLKGSAQIKGLTSNLDIEVNGETQAGTTFVIPLSDVTTVDNYKLINFKTNKKDTDVVKKKMKNIEGINLKFYLEVTNVAEAQVVIDKENGSELKGSGEGNLYIEIDTRGTFKMFGDFLVDRGIYNFKYAGIAKPFKVQQGGTISWSGSPFDAQLNLTAIYSTKANPAQLLDNINSSRKIPIDLYTNITGGLFDSQISYDIKIPNANATIASELDFILNRNDLNAKMQHFSFLLAFGTFYNQEAIGASASSGITGTASEIASSILSSILNKGDDKIKLGVGYTQGDRGDLENLNSDDQVDVSVSTQLSDRVIVNGKVGVPVGTNTQTNVVGEVKVEVLLNEAGTLRGTAFNRQNEIQNNVEDEGYTQGIGISYQVNFDNLTELGQKIGILKKKKKQEVSEKIKDTVINSTNFVNFKKKTTK